MALTVSGFAVSGAGESVQAAAIVRSTPHAAYAVVAGPYRRIARFRVSYSGTGTWATHYHAVPPNPAGMHDTNDAVDSSLQRWTLDYVSRLTVPVCGRSVYSRADRCSRLVAPILARGPTSVVGMVDHAHVDGLYAFDDATARCQLTEAPSPATPLVVPLHLSYDPRQQTISIVPSDPLAQALSLITMACPGYVDGIDGLFDNYFIPGFSFSPAYGPARWFTPAPVTIPLGTLHHATRITVQLGPTSEGKPPAGCDVRAPAVEQCRATGSWRGFLTLALVAPGAGR